MFAITIRQPFVWEIFTGEKHKEFRSWPTAHRGALAIHASVSKASLVKGWQDILLQPGGATAGELLVFGAIVGIVDVTGCTWDASEDCYAWHLANPRRLLQPISIKGQLKLWEVPPSVEAAIKAQLAA